MAFMLNLVESQERSILIDLGDAGGFEIIVRPTTAGDELSVLVASILEDADSATLRILNSIVGWKGVTDRNGREIPFSRNALASLLRSIPPFATLSIINAVSEFYGKASEDSLKNSESLSSVSCGAAS